MDGDQDAHCKNMRKEDAIIQFIKNRWTSPYAIIIYFALIKLLIHLFTNYLPPRLQIPHWSGRYTNQAARIVGLLGG